MFSHHESRDTETAVGKQVWDFGLRSCQFQSVGMRDLKHPSRKIHDSTVHIHVVFVIVPFLLQRSCLFIFFRLEVPDNLTSFCRLPVQVLQEDGAQLFVLLRAPQGASLHWCFLRVAIKVSIFSAINVMYNVFFVNMINAFQKIVLTPIYKISVFWYYPLSYCIINMHIILYTWLYSTVQVYSQQ